MEDIKENTEHYNSGEGNTGWDNEGNYNSGFYNSGDFNTGKFNCGNGNTGDSNSGRYNSGSYNSGWYNSGDSNSGWYNLGRWNAGDHNNGFFNVETPKEFLAFGKLTNRKEFMEKLYEIDFLNFKLTTWKSGELVTFEYKEAFQKSYDDLSDEQQIRQTQLLKELPNFNADIFFEISGIKLIEPKLTQEEFIEKHKGELYEEYLGE